MYHEGDNGFIFIGRSIYRRAFCIAVGIGRRDNPAEGECLFERVWELVPRLPLKLWRESGALFIEYGFGYRRRSRKLL